MTDSQTQLDTTAQKPQNPSRLAAVTSGSYTSLLTVDSYTVLLTIGLVVLLVSLAVLANTWFKHYGTEPAPILGKLTSVSSNSVRTDISAKQGLKVGDRILVLRQGVFLADLAVRNVDDDGSSAVLLAENDTLITTLAKGDTVVSSPLGRSQ